MQMCVCVWCVCVCVVCVVCVGEGCEIDILIRGVFG